MDFAKLENLFDIEKKGGLKRVNISKEIKNSGVPIGYDEDLLIEGRCNHSIIIGSTGSGKTQTITLPMLEMSGMAGESVLIYDVKNELYERTKERFQNRGYNVIKIDFEQMKETCFWNPLTLPQKLFKEGNIDKCQDLLEELGHSLLDDDMDSNSDPFWSNSTVDLFTGIALSLFNIEENVTLNRISEYVDYVKENKEDFIENLDKKGYVYSNLKGIFETPQDTMGSIIAVFNQKLKLFVSRINLSNLLSKSSFDITKFSKEKTIIYVNSYDDYARYLIPILVSQIYYSNEIYSSNNRVSIILDDFYNLKPIKNFSKILNYSRSNGIMFTIMVRGLNDLENVYTKKELEILKLCFGNIVYLLSQDIKTLEKISNMCGVGNVFNGNNIPLISVNELKTLKVFEAVILMNRMNPLKTKLLPYYTFEDKLINN